MPNPGFLQQAMVAAAILRDGMRSARVRRRIGEKRLKRVLVEAGRHVPFYRDHFRELGYRPENDYRGFEDLELLPIVNKTTIRSLYQRFQHERLDPGRLHIDYSSGTTGSPFRIPSEPTGRAIRVAAWIRVMMQNGYTPGSKALALALPAKANTSSNLLQRLGFMRRRAIDCTRPVEDQLEQVIDYRPDLLYGNRSSIDLLALELRKAGTCVDFVKTVIAAGDVVTEASRELCREAFGVPLRQLYSASETGIISADRGTEQDGQHPVYDLSRVELLDDRDQPVVEGEPGRVVATRLYSTAMPILRYDLGDSAVFRSVTESDGAPGFRIVKILSRSDEMLDLPDGRRLSLPMVYHIFNERVEIKQFKVVQTRPDRFSIYVSASRANFESVHSVLRDKLRSLFRDCASCDLIRVDSIPLDESGKVRPVVPLQEQT